MHKQPESSETAAVVDLAIVQLDRNKMALVTAEVRQNLIVSNYLLPQFSTQNQFLDVSNKQEIMLSRSTYDYFTLQISLSREQIVH